MLSHGVNAPATRRTSLFLKLLATMVPRQESLYHKALRKHSCTTPVGAGLYVAIRLRSENECGINRLLSTFRCSQHNLQAVGTVV